MALRHEIQLRQWQVVPRAYTASASLTGTDSGICATNLNASGAITFTLPQALAGREYRFFVATAQTLTVTPQSVDKIRGKAVGASYAASVVGYYMKITCIVAGAWEIEFNIGGFA
jgi:hypothetical protein